MKFETSLPSRGNSILKFPSPAQSQSPEALLLEWMQAAATSGIPNYNACSLATVNPRGRSDSRIVLIRELKNEELYFYTHRPSPKIEELESNPCCSGTFYWEELFRQIRFQGRARQLKREIVEEYFASRPRDAQIAAWTSRQSERLLSREQLMIEFAEAQRKYDGVVPCPDGFVGYAIALTQVEFWQQGEHRLHDRLRFTLENGSWGSELLYP